MMLNPISQLNLLRSFTFDKMGSALLLLLSAVAVASWYGQYNWLAFFFLCTVGYGVAYILLALLRKYNGERLRLPWLIMLVASILNASSYLAWQLYIILYQGPVLFGIDGLLLYLIALAIACVLILPDMLRDGRESVLERTRREREDRIRLEKAVLEAELKTLQAQVEPHFLYNTLSNVQYLIRHDASRAELMLSHLISYLRLALPQLRGPASTVGRELALAVHYLDLIAIRMGGRLHYRCECPDELRKHEMPPLMLISLVENAVQHGIEPKLGNGEILIAVSEKPGQVQIVVHDDGLGFQSGSAGSGVGIANIKARLEGLYGPQAELNLRSADNGGVIATLCWPKSGADK